MKIGSPVIGLLVDMLGKALQAVSNDTIEKQIRHLKQGQIKYLLNGAAIDIAQQWPPDYVVNGSTRFRWVDCDC